MPVLWGLQYLHYLLFLLSFFLCLPWQFSLLYVQISTQHSLNDSGRPFTHRSLSLQFHHLLYFEPANSIHLDPHEVPTVSPQVCNTATLYRFHTLALQPGRCPQALCEANIELALSLSLSSGISFLPACGPMSVNHCSIHSVLFYSYLK